MKNAKPFELFFMAKKEDEENDDLLYLDEYGSFEMSANFETVYLN